MQQRDKWLSVTGPPGVPYHGRSGEDGPAGAGADPRGAGSEVPLRVLLWWAARDPWEFCGHLWNMRGNLRTYVVNLVDICGNCVDICGNFVDIGGHCVYMENTWKSLDIGV